MGGQLSLKAALPLAEFFATAPDRCSNTGPRIPNFKFAHDLFPSCLNVLICCIWQCNDTFLNSIWQFKWMVWNFVGFGFKVSFGDISVYCSNHKVPVALLGLINICVIIEDKSSPMMPSANRCFVIGIHTNVWLHMTSSYWKSSVLHITSGNW